MLEIILPQQRTPHLLKQKKLMQTQEDHSNLIQALNTASSKSVKESSLDSATKDVHAIKYKMSKAKERRMAYFRSLHSHLQVLSKEDLQGTRIEHGFKRAFMSLFGQDADTFTSTMLLNVDQLQKQLDKDELQEDGSMAAFWVVNNQFQKFIDSQFTLDYDNQITDKYFVEYTGIEVKHFRYTLLQHMGNVKKFVVEGTRHQRHGIESEVQDDNSRSGNDTDADDADIRPIYDQEPMAEVQLTAEYSGKGFCNCCFKNDLRKLKDNSVDTKFAKTSVIGKPVLQSLRNQSVVRQSNAFKSKRPQMSKPRFASQVDVNSLSRPVTQHYLPKRRESVFAKPDHMIASSDSRNISKNMPRFSSNDMVHNHYLDEARKKTNHNKPVDQKSHTQKPGRQIFTGHRFSPNKISVVYEKTSPISDLRWKPTGRIFKSIGLKWIPTGKLFDSYTSKDDSEPSHGSNVDISKIHECKQTLDLSAEFWYNTNFYIVIQTTSFEAVYGQKPPVHVPYMPGESVVEIVDRTLLAREQALNLIKFNLVRAQDRMRSLANKHMTYRVFDVGMGSTQKMGMLPHYGSNGLLFAEPIAILDRKIKEVNNRVAVYVLVKWSNHTDEDAT
uniref:Reverse transcriptase n=1 Tax=Tanacetum cinerariifolium TaxID=118510 RepID=A0A6L2JRW6_TANCI|nr:reverse transcriptase [Tanacetum cinerariifolium]